ncbi:hypothetical protein QVD17_04062 [Tagetes erecta]|uniref:Uncharacterized protein n=1 Tax=Tagetes erecta TaxID=13708 RepID=A0AAD8PAF0_TARER|nr:hypothetical protein QVD17_04062 [Tagetes erecta]
MSGSYEECTVELQICLLMMVTDALKGPDPHDGDREDGKMPITSRIIKREAMLGRYKAITWEKKPTAT